MTSSSSAARLRVLLPALALALMVGCTAEDTTDGAGATPSPTPTPTPSPTPPPTPRRSLGIQVDTAIDSGELFRFTLSAPGIVTQAVNVTQTGTPSVFGIAIPEGSTYTVAQTEGPRSCTLSGNATGTVGFGDILVTAQCGAAVSGSLVQGQLRGPVGVTVSLTEGFSGAGTVALTVGGGGLYGSVDFSFPTALPDGATYQVNMGPVPAGQICGVYQASLGTMPVPAGRVKAGCEFEYDHLSRSTAAQATTATSRDVVIGGAGPGQEGRYVAFVSTDSRLAGATGGSNQVFWRDRQTGETRLVSANASGAAGNNNSEAPAISPDGQTVVFESVATNLVGGDTNGRRDVFAWSATGGGVQRLSVDANGVQADGDSFAPAVSADGRVVAYHTSARNLVAGVTSFGANIVRLDRTTGQHTMVSLATVGGNTGRGTGGAWASISDDGSRIAFWSIATDLVAGDTNGLWDIFVFRNDGSPLRRVSLTSTGTERRDPGTESANRNVQPAISGNGRYVAFATTGADLVPDDSNGRQDLFVVDVDAPAGSALRRVVSVFSGEGNGDTPIGQGERPSLSADGQWIAFTTNAPNFVGTAGQVVLFDLARGEPRRVTPTDGSGSVSRPALSPNAAYVAFGAARTLDPRFAADGLFAYFSAVSRAWWWID